MKSKFCASKEHPHHLSVGAVLYNTVGEICAHTFIRAHVPQNYLHLMGDLDVGYQLMHETLEDNESLESAALRGVAEEFGAEGRVECYLGTTQLQIKEVDHVFEKTVPFFAVSLTKQNERPKNDGEFFTEVAWHDPRKYIELLQTQDGNNGLNTQNEVEITKSFIAWYESK